MRAFRAEYLDPLEPELLRHDVDAILPKLMNLRTQARELSLWSPQLPRELGGQGFSLSETQPISEELGRSPLGHFVCNLNAPDVSNPTLQSTTARVRAVRWGSMSDHRVRKPAAWSSGASTGMAPMARIAIS